MNIHSFAIIGGDKRSIALAEMLVGLGHNVKMYGFTTYERELSMQCKNLEKTIAGADYVIGPTPTSTSGGVLNAPFCHETILVEDVFKLIKPHQLLLAGYMKPETTATAKKHNVRAIDILTREELLVLNAIPTAEGAIKIAIEETDITLHGNNMMVIGYGRIGAILCGMLRGMGANVTAVVRPGAKGALASSVGHKAILIEDMEDRLHEADIIFNTVPEILLDGRNLHLIRPDTLLIDLASPPYGIDVDASRDLGLRVLFANSLPGKVAPKTTAKYILSTVSNIIAEETGISLQDCATGECVKRL